MKRFTFFTVTTLLLFLLSNRVLAQDFKVTIASTDICAGYINPLKAGGSIQFQINVKNNRADTCTVSIDKNAMGLTSSWVAIDNNSQVLFPQQSKNFLLTLSIPANTNEGEYAMFLYFNAYDKTNFNHSFNYNTQTVIVDNSIPLIPSFSVSQTSTKVYVSSWSSYDAISNTYTIYNSSSGILGIKSYTVTLKNPDNSVKETKTINATSDNYYTFQGLSSNTNYKVSVTAADLAGNTSTKEIAATTAPAPPTISSSAQSFCNITLNWTASSGATSYKLYNATSSTPVLLTTTSNTSFVVNGLTSGTNYKFYVIAFNSLGLGSDVENPLFIQTLSVPTPTISGSSPVCSSGTTFTVRNKPNACSLTWVAGPSLTLYSTNENSAIFKSTGNYANSWIKAIYDSGCGISEFSYSVDAGTPTPGLITILWDVPPRRFSAFITPIVSATSYKWYLDGVLKFNSPEYDVIFARQIWNCEHIYDVDVVAVNSCGVSALRHTEVIEDPCDYSFKIYPNPVSTEITISQSDLNTMSSAIENVKEPKSIETVKIIDNFGNIYFEKRYIAETKEVKINISNLKKGTYFVILNNEDLDYEVYTIHKN